MLDYYNLDRQQDHLQPKIDNRIKAVLKHGKYILGPEVYELEEKLAAYTGAKFCITCANGTDALQIALMALGVGPGDEVITPVFSYIAAAEAIKLLGATPIYVDVEIENFNLIVKSIERKINEKTKAILPVSLYGQTANFDELSKLSSLYNIPIIEDAAQSFGAKFKGRFSCNLSTIACTSFFPTKPLGCYGDGGAVFTSDENLAEYVRKIARHGQTKRYFHEHLGLNSRLDSIQAAILLEKLELLDEEISKRNKIAAQYNTAFSGLSKISPPIVREDYMTSWAQYTLKCEERSVIQRNLMAHNIPSAIHYPLPLNKQNAVRDDSEEFTNAEYLSNVVLSIPVNAYMDDKDIIKIIRTIENSVS